MQFQNIYEITKSKINLTYPDKDREGSMTIMMTQKLCYIEICFRYYLLINDFESIHQILIFIS